MRRAGDPRQSPTTRARRNALISFCAAILVGLATGPAAAAHLLLGLDDPSFGPRLTQPQDEAVNAAKASFVRLAVQWSTVAPEGTNRPVDFQPADPNDLRYSWHQLDSDIRSAAHHHLNVILTFVGAPQWAEGAGQVRPYVSPGGWNPNPTEFASFLHAAAVRYSGSFPDPQNPGATLPRVKYWEPWNEPNIPGYFSAPNPVSAYRTLLNDAYGTLKSVRRDNVVIFGGLAPVSPVPGSIPPLDFGAQLLCLHRVGSSFAPNRSCPQRVKFDAFAIHPYALAATPTKHAYKSGDVLVGDMGEINALVNATNRFHTAIPSTGHQIWVTEFHWYTNPPNPIIGDSEPTAARYVAYSMYEMWKAGASVVIWQQVVDGQGHDAASGAGLYSSSGQPKLTLQAFAFPAIASVTGSRGFAWGRAPVSHSVRVQVERAVGRGWRTVASVKTGGDGVFEAYFKASANGVYRARVVGGPTSLPYNSTPIPPRRTHLFNLF